MFNKYKIDKNQVLYNMFKFLQERLKRSKNEYIKWSNITISLSESGIWFCHSHDKFALMNYDERNGQWYFLDVLTLNDYNFTVNVLVNDEDTFYNYLEQSYINKYLSERHI